MTAIPGVHEAHGGTLEVHGDGQVVTDYGRPTREASAARNGVGVIDHAPAVLSLRGPDRHAALADAILGDPPRTDGSGRYDHVVAEGRIVAGVELYAGAERTLLLVDRTRLDSVRDRLGGTAVTTVSDEVGVFGVVGPTATEKLASVLTVATPADRLSFVRGSIEGAGVSAIRTDAPAGEEEFRVVCGADDAATVFEALTTRGVGAAPIGRRAYRTLTIEAGTPETTEVVGRDPAVTGRADGDAGRLVGIEAGRVPQATATIATDGDAIGTVTRAADSPTRGPIGFGYVDRPVATGTAIGVDGRPGTVVALPFVTGSEPSGRVPQYD